MLYTDKTGQLDGETDGGCWQKVVISTNILVISIFDTILAFLPCNIDLCNIENLTVVYNMNT